MKKYFLFPLVVLACLNVFVAKAAEIDFKKPLQRVEAKVPNQFKQGSIERIVEFTELRNGITPNDVIGKFETGNFFSKSSFLYRNTETSALVFLFQFGEIFKEQAIKLGLTSSPALKSAFEQGNPKPADFKVAATLLGLDYRMSSVGTVGITMGEKGEAYAKIKWEVYSERSKKVVYSSTLEASHFSSKEELELVFKLDFSRAVVNSLMADPGFSAAIYADESPEN